MVWMVGLVSSHVRYGSQRINVGMIAAAGGRLVRREGVAAITMRSVAAAVGTTPMALYRCFESGEALRQASVDHALRSIRDPSPDGTPRRRFIAWADQTRARLRPVDGLAAACLADWPELREGCRVMERLVVVAADHTPDQSEQVAIAHAVFSYTLAGSIADQAAFRRRRRTTLPAVQRAPRIFPRLARMQAEVTRIDSSHEFLHGLEQILDGLLAPTTRRTPPRTPPRTTKPLTSG